MSTLLIRLPPSVVADKSPDLSALACPFALVTDAGMMEQQGLEPLSTLSATVAKANRVTLLVDGSNVSLLHVQVPPLSAARLKAALPGLAEELLLCDPVECVIVAGNLTGGLLTLAVIQREWLERLNKTFFAFGARNIVALPAQLCLPYQTGQNAQPGQPLGHPMAVNAAIHEWGSDLSMTLRLTEQDGIGLTTGGVTRQTEENDSEARLDAAAQEAIRSLCAVVPEAPITLYVPQSKIRTYKKAATPHQRINVLADDWLLWVAGARITSLDLMAGTGRGAGHKLDWHPWRWPLALAATVLLVNTAALNFDWWRMSGESRALRTVMIQTYKSAYPKESVIIDPLAQMQQKYAAAKRSSGQSVPDDFTAITGSFAEAWADIASAANKTPALISALEYRERSLFVHLKTGGVPTPEIKTALAKRGLSLNMGALDHEHERSGAAVWQIRSEK